MSDYAYTYPEDRSYLDQLTDTQRALANKLLDAGDDLAVSLAAADASDVDKQAIAAVWS